MRSDEVPFLLISSKTYQIKTLLKMNTVLISGLYLLATITTVQGFATTHQMRNEDALSILKSKNEAHSFTNIPNGSDYTIFNCTTTALLRLEPAWTVDDIFEECVGTRSDDRINLALILQDYFQVRDKSHIQGDP